MKNENVGFGIALIYIVIIAVAGTWWFTVGEREHSYKVCKEEYLASHQFTERNDVIDLSEVAPDGTLKRVEYISPLEAGAWMACSQNILYYKDFFKP